MLKNNLLSHAGGTSLTGLSLLRLLLSDTLVQELGVLGLSYVSRVLKSFCDILTAASLEASAFRRLMAIRCLLCWRRCGVTSR